MNCYFWQVDRQADVVASQEDCLCQVAGTGIGYVISDPTTGSGAYLISGGLAGGSGTSELALSSLLATKGEAFSCIAETAGDLLYAAAIIVALIMSRGHPWFAGIGGTIFFYLAVAFVILIIIAIISNCISLGRAGAANNACKRTFS